MPDRYANLFDDFEWKILQLEENEKIIRVVLNDQQKIVERLSDAIVKLQQEDESKKQVLSIHNDILELIVRNLLEIEEGEDMTTPQQSVTNLAYAKYLLRIIRQNKTSGFRELMSEKLFHNFAKEHLGETGEDK